MMKARCSCAGRENFAKSDIRKSGASNEARSDFYTINDDANIISVSRYTLRYDFKMCFNTNERNLLWHFDLHGNSTTSVVAEF